MICFRCSLNKDFYYHAIPVPSIVPVELPVAIGAVSGGLECEWRSKFLLFILNLVTNRPRTLMRDFSGKESDPVQFGYAT
jgi:hypothetical protein